jgi:hypothetical protein
MSWSYRTRGPVLGRAMVAEAGDSIGWTDVYGLAVGLADADAAPLEA